MKKICIVFTLIALCLMADAQSWRVPSIKRNQTEKKQPKTKASKAEKDTVVLQPIKVEEETPKTDIVAVAGYKLLCDAVENAFIVVRQKYNVRREGSNVSGNDFFGESYSIIPILKYGYGIDNRYRKPWEFDVQAAPYGDCPECLFSVDVSDYRRLSDKRFKSFDLQTEIADTIASGIYFVRDLFMNNSGMDIITGNGVKDGYMVWFRHTGEGEISYEIVPTVLTYNENFIFPIEQPKDIEQIVGGMFIKLNAAEPGIIKIDLLGMARLDPYGKKNWELVKPISVTTPPQEAPVEENVENEKSSTNKSDKKADKEETIIPEDNSSDNKNAKSGKKNKNTK